MSSKAESGNENEAQQQADVNKGTWVDEEAEAEASCQKKHI
jgi:hypothetical protein